MRLATRFQQERGHLFPWAPVMLGAGIAIYFSLPVEPDRVALWALALAALAFGILAIRQRHDMGPLWLGATLVALGPLIGAWRCQQVTAPVLDHRFYGAVEGRIIGIDRSVSDKLRLTLDRVVLQRIEAKDTPLYVRVSLHGPQDQITLEPGMVVLATANLTPPNGPVEPGGFDFRRQAWFDSLGAVGYTRKPVLMLEPPDDDWRLWLFRARMAMSAAIQRGLPGPEGAFAAAMMTGDRSGMDEATTETLRVSNLAHLISISGLHMVLLTGTVFATLRFGLALIPRARLWPLKKIGAGVAALAGFFYLALSGWDVPTERAFVMVAVALGAVLLGRRAISLRGLAIAALIVLIERPESVTEPGFQMSFAATLALVVIFQWLDQDRMRFVPAAIRPGVMLILSSLVAGLATAPFAAAHFNRIAAYGLIANLAAAPAMSILFMPAALLWVVLAPLGLGQIALWLIKPAMWWVLSVAEWVSALPHPATLVKGPPALVVPLIALAMIWPALWQGRWQSRAFGLVPLLLAGILWAGAERPAALIADDGALVGVMTAEGRALTKPKGQGFAAENWLQDDGDQATQIEAAARALPKTDAEWTELALADAEIAVLAGKKSIKHLNAACLSADLVIASEPLPKGFSGPCLALGKWQMQDMGPIAIYLRDQDLVLIPTRGATQRPWDQAPPGRVFPTVLTPKDIR